MKTRIYPWVWSALMVSLVMGIASAQDAPLSRAWDAASIKEAGIVIQTVERKSLAQALRAPGEVKADAYSTELVTPRVESIVLERKVRLGDMVKAGQPLMVLSSVQVAESQGALIVAEQEWRRVTALGPQAVSGRRYAEVQVQRDQARARLKAFGLSDAQIGRVLQGGSARADGSYALLAPTAGRVTTDQFLVGERVEPGRTLFTLVKEDTVWVEAQLPPADVRGIAAEAGARILAHGIELGGHVVQVGHQLDERTRTVPVRVRVDNRRDLLHPGDLVDVRLQLPGHVEELAVPVEAVVWLKGQSVVFVAEDDHAFDPVPVTTGETRNGWVVIREGLSAGQRYVSAGTFAIKARLLRSQLGEE
ncbi:efflux RND transporter periplasmic adaptor subunit [Dyella sp.]|uniref:efflux RND transporter periplasmic adaptor subunit n=1 Tax=Dyella sp. TaxID=1869338 RepID=UPI002ED21361